METVKLSKAMLRALKDFADPGGHAFGEYAYLSRATAHALEARGLVRLTSKRFYDTGRSMGWGVATDEGRAVLRQIRGW